VEDVAVLIFNSFGFSCVTDARSTEGAITSDASLQWWHHGRLGVVFSSTAGLKDTQNPLQLKVFSFFGLYCKSIGWHVTLCDAASQS